MAHSKLIITSTQSAKQLANSVCKELDKLVTDGIKNLGGNIENIDSWDLFKRKEFMDLQYIQARNIKDFGTSNFKLWPISLKSFADTSSKHVIKTSLRAADVYILHNSFVPQPDTMELIKKIKMTFNGSNIDAQLIQMLNEYRAVPTISQNNMELNYLISAIMRDGRAKHSTVIEPLLSNSRQDHRRRREGTVLRDHMKMIEDAGVKDFVAFDVHSAGSTAISHNMHFDNLYLTSNFIKLFDSDRDELLKKYNLKTGNLNKGRSIRDLNDVLVICAPDAGGVKRAQLYSDRMQLPTTLVVKDRDYDNENSINSSQAYGQFKDKIVIVPEDMIDTGGTMCGLIREVYDKGAIGVIVIVTHTLLNNNSVRKFDELYEEGILWGMYSTNTVWRDQDFYDAHKWLKLQRIEPVIAKTILAMNQDDSVGHAHMDLDVE